MGRRPAVLMRGYKAVAGKSDEAEMLRIELGRPAGLMPRSARQALAVPLPSDVPVFAQANRRAAAREAVGAGADVLVMDDGFQHLRLRRDLDIVLIDATCPFGFGHVLPRGLLREPLCGPAAADCPGHHPQRCGGRRRAGGPARAAGTLGPQARRSTPPPTGPRD